MTDFESRAKEAKQASYAMAVLPTEVKDAALLKIAEALNVRPSVLMAEIEEELNK